MLKLYDRKIKLILTSSFAVQLLFWWSFFEASMWFIFPDFLLLFCVLFQHKKTVRFLLASIVGSIVGIAAFYVAIGWFDISGKFFDYVPLADMQMVEDVRQRFTDAGVGAAREQVSSGYPGKAWTLAARMEEVDLLQFLLIVGVVRLVRMSVVAALAYLVSISPLGKTMRKNVTLWLVGLLIIAWSFICSGLLYDDHAKTWQAAQLLESE